MSYTPGDELDRGRISTCCGATMLADIDLCSDCKEWNEGEDLEDGEVPHAVWLAEAQRMKQLYDGEVTAGLHVPPGGVSAWQIRILNLVLSLFTFI